MNIRFSNVFVALGCIFLASCYPFNENRGKKSSRKPPEKSVSSADQQKIQAQRDQLKKQQELKNKEQPKDESTQPGNTGNVADNDTTTSGTTGTKPPTEKKPRDYVYASKVPGREGMVFSPYNNKMIDVSDMPTGTLVADPTYPESEKKYFRVP